MFRQVLITRSRFPEGWRVQLEILKVRQRGPRRVGIIRGQSAALAYQWLCDLRNGPPLGVVLDHLTEHPEEVPGLDRGDVLAAVEAVRERGCCFVMPRKRSRDIAL